MKKVTIISPCFNEQEALPIFFNTITPILKGIQDYSFDFVLVNDGSKDDTLAVMNQIYMSRDDVTIVNLSRNFGQNPALKAGLGYAKGDYAITMDIDLQDPPELIKEICLKFSEGYEVVSPHRQTRKEDTFFKRTTAGLFYKIVNKLEGKKVLPDNVGCYRGLSRRAVDQINALTEKDAFIINQYAFIGLKNVFIEYDRPKRSAGNSKYNLNKLVAHALNITSSETANPLYYSLFGGGLLTGFSSISFITLLVFYILGLFNILVVKASYGHNLILLFMIASLILFFLGLIWISVGIVAAYEHNILINTRNRPIYIVDKVYVPDGKKK